MAHYVCTGGCNGIAESKGVCNTQACMREHMPLTICNCTDGMHKEAFENFGEKAEAETKAN